MRTMCSRDIFTKKCRQQQIFDSDLRGAWHYNHATFTPIAKNFMLYCRLIYMLSILCVRLTMKVKVGIPESFKVGWYPPWVIFIILFTRLLCDNSNSLTYEPRKEEKSNTFTCQLCDSTSHADWLFTMINSNLDVWRPVSFCNQCLKKGSCLLRSNSF